MQIKGVKAKTKSEVPHFVHQVGRYLKDYIYIYISRHSVLAWVQGPDPHMVSE